MTETLWRIDESTEKLGLENVGSLISVRDSILETIKESEAGIKAALENLHITTPRDPLSTRSNGKDGSNEPAFNQTTEITSLVNGLIDQKAKYESDHAFLSSLLFDDMRLRQESVKATHSDTFQWIFQDNTEENPATHFPTWLKEGNGVFWVSGKAGSGKSTLMKLLSQSPQTHDMLKTWAGNKELAIARYYFWTAGSRLQKSREGLIQTLLFELLRSCPEAIPFVRKAVPDLPTNSEQWAMSKLMSAVTSLIAHPLSKKFCIFIDGLDEFEGDSDDLIELIDQLVSSDKVKICCSSRPWSSFEDAFGQNKDCKLRLEDLTERDIRKFVSDNFQQHKRFHKYARDARFLALVEEVVNRANGVFIWVVLVVKSLRDGLTHADRISDLERRLRAMPSDLEQLYHRMIQSVSPFYRQQSSELLIICSKEPVMRAFQAINVNILDEFDDNPTILTHGVESEILGDLNDWEDDMTRRLDARTKGLIELYMPQYDDRLENSSIEKISDASITVLHRSVYDFLTTPTVNEELRGHCRPEFDPLRRLLQAQLILLFSPSIPFGMGSHDSPSYHSNVMQVFRTSRHMELAQGKAPADLLRIAHKHYPSFQWIALGDDGYSSMTLQSQGFLSVAGEWGLNLYVAEVLRENPDAVNNEDANCFFSALYRALLFWKDLQPHICYNTVRLILENGANVSRLEGDTGRTAWSIFLESLDKSEEYFQKAVKLEGGGPRFRDDAEKKEIFASLISHGADLGDERAERVIRKLFSHKDAEYLLSLSPTKDGHNGNGEDGEST